MSETFSRPTYSLEERAVIRDLLIEYAKRHRLKMSGLCTDIENKTGRTGEVSRSTLLRFLNFHEKYRTNDGFIKICDDFVQKFCNFPGVVKLAYPLAAFLSKELGGGMVMPISVHLPGTFEGRSAAAAAGTPEQEPVPYSTLTIEESPHRSCVLVREEVFDVQLAAGSLFDDKTRRGYYSGYGVMSGEILFVLARNVATKRPRAYWLVRDKNDLTGRITEAEQYVSSLEINDVQVTYRRKEQG